MLLFLNLEGMDIMEPLEEQEEEEVAPQEEEEEEDILQMEEKIVEGWDQKEKVLLMEVRAEQKIIPIIILEMEDLVEVEPL